MAYGDNKQQSRSITDVLYDFTKFQHDNLANERNYNQTVLKNLADIGKYQRDIRTQNMFMRRTNATQRYNEAELFARTETDESKLPKWLEVMNQARREIGSTTDHESGFKEEGMFRELTMDDLMSMRRMDQIEKKANGEIPTGGKPIADKIKDLSGIKSTVANNAQTTVPNVTNNTIADKDSFYPGYVAGSENTSVTRRSGLFTMPENYNSFLNRIPVNETFDQKRTRIANLFKVVKPMFEE